MLIALAATPASANLVQNGNFETNGGVGMIGPVTTLASWTVGSMVNDGSGAAAPFDFVVDANASTSGFNTPAGTIHLWGPGQGINNGFTGSANGGEFFGSDGGFATAPIFQFISGLTVGN
jgi:hypothetical protein